jgi:hypothetical protein
MALGFWSGRHLRIQQELHRFELLLDALSATYLKAGASLNPAFVSLTIA